MRPGGPRGARPGPYPPGHPAYGRPPPQGGGNTRNDVFENIFGRPAGGHHLGHGPPGAPHLQQRGYGAYPGAGAGGGQLLNPAQPSYPPQFPSSQPHPHHPQQRAYPHPQQQPHPQQPHPQPPPHPHVPGRPQHARIPDSYAPQPQQTPYDGVSLYDDPPPNGYARVPSGRQPVLDPPNRRTSLLPAPSQYVSGSGFNAPPNGARIPPPGPSHNGYPAERLPHVNTMPESFVPMPSPQPRSVSATSSTSTVTTNVPPRSRSLHHASGPGKIRVQIPSPNLNTGSLLPFPESSLELPPAHDTPGPSDHMSPPPDYDFTRAMGSVNLNSGSATPGLGDTLDGIDSESSSLKGPWDPVDYSSSSSNLYPQRPSVRHTSSSSASSQRRSHTRQLSDSSITSSIYTVSGQRMAPLSQINNSDAPDSPGMSPSTPTGSENGFGTFHRLSGRKSMESTHSLPLPTTSANDSPLPPGAASSVFDHRATSFSGSSVNRRDIVSAVRSSGSTFESGRGHSGMYASASSPVASQRSLARHQSGTKAKALVPAGPVIPALLSNVAEAFRQIIQPQEIIKDGIAYKEAFDGRSAVSIIAELIKTPDRNLALLLGRALDSQKFFHDVTYAHRLRDTDKEVYQFKERLVAPFLQDGVMDSPSSDHLGLSTRPPSTSSGTRRLLGGPNDLQASDSQTSFFTRAPKASPATVSTPVQDVEEESDEDDLPNGVFTLLTNCYSPTCSADQLCYSINCPRRMEQMKRLNMKSAHPGLQRKLEDESMLEDTKETGTLWIFSVSKEILDSVDDTEKKRQEAINEVCYTERDFVRHLEYMRDFWMKPLLASEDIFPPGKREELVRKVFWNVEKVHEVCQVLAERLTKRQKKEPVIGQIGDIILDCVRHFEPFVEYGGNQLWGRYEFEKEKGANPAFQKFVEETERKPEANKLELNGYLTKPTTRLGRYPLLLEAVLKHTPADHPDKKDLPEAIKQIKAYLARVNEATGRSENHFELVQMDQKLVFTSFDRVDLRLTDKSRRLLHKGPMKRRGGTQGENADLMAFLLDHAFVLVKPKWINKSEQYKMYRKPIPLELLVLLTPEDSNSTKLSGSRSKLITRTGARGGPLPHVPPTKESKHGFSLTVYCLGRKGYSMQLWIDTYASRKAWVEQIEQQQQIIRDRSLTFTSETISDNFFNRLLRPINCISPYDNGNRMIYGTDEGVYFSNLRDPKLREPVRVINLLGVTQVDVIEELQILLVLHERSVTTFPLDCLDPRDPDAALKRGKKISSHTSFFKSGICLGRTLVAVVKSSALSSTIKVLEPVDVTARGKKQQSSILRRINGSQETLKVFKEFYIPLESFSIYFLKTKLCVGCQKGFEIVDLETLDMQSLLDPSDSSLDFVLKRDGVRPMAIYRVESDFLLCYDEYAFYVNKNGWRSRPKWSIIWEGHPTAFALQFPYVIAFDPTFIEVRHVESGHLVQIIPGSNISCLFADMPPSTVNAAPPPPPNRQLMYPGHGGMYARPPQQGFAGYPQQPQGYGRPPVPGYGGVPPPPQPPQPLPPFRNFLYRPQVIFTSDDGHVQFLKLPPPQKGRRSSDSKSVHSMRA